MKGTAITAALLLVIDGLVALQVTTPWEQPAPTTAAWPRVADGKTARLQLGVTTPALAQNSYRAWSEDDLAEVNRFEQAARRHSDIVMWFADWAHVADFDARQAAAVAARGSTPEISWEPWDASNRTADQPRYSLASIIAGTHDRYIRRWARQIAAYGKPVRLRFAHEMNGRWYPWAERANGNSEGEFVDAWRHVHWIFATERAHNVTWVWSPVAGRVNRTLYPGRRQVDALAVSGFIAADLFRGRWRSFSKAFGKTLTGLHELAPSKPVMLSEIGVAGSPAAKARWIRGMFAEIKRRPYVRSLIWFDLRKEADWRISSSAGARAAFSAGVSEAV